MNGSARYRGANGHYDHKDSWAAGAFDAQEARTDRTRWRLLDEQGRQTWVYLRSKKEAEEWPQSIADKHHLGMPIVCVYSGCR